MSDNGVVIALGYFDSVHVGHRKVIEKGVNLSKQLNCKPVVFTFDGNLRSAIGKGDEKFVYTTSERKTIFQGGRVSTEVLLANKRRRRHCGAVTTAK